MYLLQYGDGGFPFGMKKGNLSKINETTVALWWMQEMNLLTSPSANQVFTHLLTAQWEDGGWDDSPIAWQWIV